MDEIDELGGVEWSGVAITWPALHGAPAKRSATATKTHGEKDRHRTGEATQGSLSAGSPSAGR